MEQDDKLQLLFIASMISEFSGYTLQEISNLDQSLINSYIETFKRALNYAQN